MERKFLYEENKKYYHKKIKIKKIKPRLFWERCICCNHEFKKEPLYKCSFPMSIDGMILDTYWTEYGCTNCFHNENEFKEFLINEGFLDKYYFFNDEAAVKS